MLPSMMTRNAFEDVSNAFTVVELPTDVQTPIHTRSLRHSFLGWLTGYAIGWLMDHEKRGAEAFVGLVGFVPPRRS